MNGLNGIIIRGKVYETVGKGQHNCSDCALYDHCKAKGCNTVACDVFGYGNYIFRFSQELTDKLNSK